MKTIQFFALFATLACATSLSAATLQSLVTNEHKDGDVIVVPNGTYEPSNLITETRHLTFRAETDGGVIIDGGNTTRCVDLSDTITLEGFVLQNGKADQGGGVRGGTILRTTVQHCSATFGGGSYKTHARASIYKGNSAAFFGMAAYGGSVFSCRVEGNTSSAYGGGMGALFGVTVANTSVTGNTALRDNAGVLASPAQNMVYFGNVAERGLYKGAPMNSANALGSEVENAVSVAEEDIFNDVAAGDYSLNVNKATNLIKDKGDTALGGNYDTLWYDTDLAGRPRMLGQSIDLGPYEIADTFTVTCKVVGVGSVTISPNFIQEGDPVTLTATADATYLRDFIGFYVNGELISTEKTCTYKPVKSDAIEARFAGLSANTTNLSSVLGQLHPTIREEVTLADGNYTISGLTKAVAFVGRTIEGTTVTLSDDCKDSVFVNATVMGTASNATLHRCLVSDFSGSDLTLTSSVIASNCGAMSGSAVNVTAYSTLPAGLAATDCVTLNGTTNTVAGAILPKGDANIDAGQGSSLVPYDNLDIGGRPRVIGTKIDRGAHECHYVTLTVEAEGYYETLTPAVGAYDRLTGDVIALSGTSPRAFKGWTLEDGTLVSAELSATTVVPTANTTLKATFAGFTMTPSDAVPEGTQAADTITLAAGTYTQDFNTPAKIVGTGKQGDVILTRTITGATLEAVTLQNATLENATLNRCYVDGGTIANGKVYNSILVNVSSATGEYVNNTTVNTALPDGAINTRALTETVEDYTPPQAEADNGGSMNVEQREALGDYDYYGNPRVNNSTIDKGAVEYVWAPYVVTINVVGHGLVSPRGAVKVVRGETLYFTVSEDPKHPRGAAVVEHAQWVSEGLYRVDPKADMTVTVTFPGLTVGPGQYADITAAIAEAQEGETITVAPGTYGAVDVKGKRLKLVAASSNPYDTIIDAQGLTRAVKLADGAEIIGFTIQNGLSNEGAGVYGGTVRRSVIRRNTLTYNGFGAGVSKVFAESCLIVDNGSTAVERSNGGGAANSELLNCTVVRNVADKGAGLYDCTAKNAVIALNVDLTGASSDWTGDSVEPDPSDCCTPTSGGIAVDASKLFVDAANGDWRLQEGVACVNVGTADERLSALDVTGAPRIYGEAVDMGALEWNAPDRKVKISLQGRGIATVSYTKENVTTAATVKWGTTETLSVPYGTDTLTLSWTEDVDERALAGITADGVMIANSRDAEHTDFTWTLVTRDTVNVDLVFVAEDLYVNTNETLTAALASAIAGETIHLAAGEYTTAIMVGAGITVDGGKDATLAGGVTLADGAVLKNATVTTTGVVGPETGSATLQYCVVTEVNGTAVERHVIVKTCLIHNNAGSGLKDATAYLSTIAANQGAGVTGASKLYGSIVWGNNTDVTSSVEVVDSYVGGNPRFILPAPDGENYALMSSSPAIDVAKMAQWEGFTEADRALTDLAGNPRPRLTGFDAGAYELQTDATMDTLWTWYGTDYSMDGTVSGAHWRQMAYGAPRSVPNGEDARITDRAGYTSATLKVDGDSSFGHVAFLNANTDLRIEDAGGMWTIASLANKSTASALTIDAKLYVGSAFYQNGGSLTLEPNADFTLGGHFSAVNIPVKQMGGTFTVASGNADMTGSSTYLLNDGRFNFGTYLNLRDSAILTISGGELSGGEISIAQAEGKTPLLITGGSVNVTRLETGDTGGARWGHVLQTGGTVTITGSGSGKQAPLHISHWSGNSTYTLRGGELNVPNGEVRLGQDGNGTLRLEGGVAKLNTVAISSGKFQLAGGTIEAIVPAGTLTAEAVEGTVSTIIAYPKDATGVTLNLSGTGTVNLAKGSYRGTITDQHVMLGEKVYFYGTIDHSDGNEILSLPGTNYASIEGSYKPGRIALSSEPVMGVRQPILGVTDGTGATKFTAADVELTGKWATCCTLEVVSVSTTQTSVWITRTGDPEAVEEGVVSTTPIITVDGNTTWSDETKWSVPFVQNGAAIVNADSSGTLHIDPSSQVKMSSLTFNVPEGVTLNVTATTMPHADIVKKTGLGTLKWSTKLNYETFNEGEGTFIAAASGQGFGGKAFETMALRVEANCTLVGQSRINVSIIENKTLTLETASVVDGSITMVHTDWSNNGVVTSSNAVTFIGDLVTNDKAMAKFIGPITFAGNSTINFGNFYTEGNVRLTGNVKLNSVGGNGRIQTFAPGLKTLDIGTLNVELNHGKLGFLNNQWPDGAMKVGSGTLTFPAGYGLAGTAVFSGPVSFAESLTTTGALHFKSDAVVAIPYGCTLTAADEIRVEPGARFVITPPQDYLADDATVPLLVSTKTAGLRVDQLATVAVAWATTPSDVAISNPIASLNGDTLQYTIGVLNSVKVWTGAVSSDWSNVGNWSGAGTGDAVLFTITSSPSQKVVTLSQSVELSRIMIQSGVYTFSGGANGYAFEGKPDVTQSDDSDEQPVAIWQTFFSRGSYMLHEGATAKLALNDWTYSGSFMGSGDVIVTEGRFALGAASNAFVGNMAVESGATLRLCNASALYNASVTVKGTLAVETPTSVASLASDAGTLALSKDAPLEVRQALTGNTLSIQLTDITEVGDWTLLTYPATTSTTFELVDATRGAYLVAALKRTETALMLVVRSSEDIEWTGTKPVDGVTTDVWKVNGAAVDVTEPGQKNLFFNDVEGVATASVALPAEPRSLTVTAQTTRYTLLGTLTHAPITVANGAEVTLATTSATPTSVSNEGVIVVTGSLDLTQASLSGFGRYIAGSGGVIRIGAQTLAESTATFVRNGGQIIVVTEGDFSLPESRIPTENGTFIKEGEGTLYVAPAALTQPVEVHSGTLAPTGAMALKARYFKFEALERFNTSLGNTVATSLADFTMMRDGQKLAWPNSTESAFVRFDSGSTHSILIGIENDEQKRVSATGNLTDLLDHNPSTELIWGEWHAFYCAGGAHQRNYFVIDAGEDGLLFTGYNVAVPSSLLSFFKKWTVAAANDISDWRPSLQASTVTENENQVWQSLDERTLTQPMEALTPRAWLTPNGYSARRASGFWSKFSAPITLNAGTTLDLTKTIGTSGILQDQVEMASVTGEGTVILPTSLQVKADTFVVKSLNLVGSSVLSKPISATTAAAFDSLVVSESVATAFNNCDTVQHVLVEGYTGALPTLLGMTSPADGGMWALRLEGRTLLLVLEGAQRELVATLTNEVTVWEDLRWCDGLGTQVDYIDWAKVQTATIQLSEASPDVAQVTIDKVVNLNTLTTLAFDFGATQQKTIALAGSGKLLTPQMILTANDTKTAYGRLALLSAGLISTDTAAIQVKDSMTLSIASANVFEGETQINLTAPRFVGNGTLEIAAPDGTISMVNNGGEFTGNVLVSDGTLLFPNGGSLGPGHGRTIMVTGATAALATGTYTDATGYNTTGSKLVLTDGGTFKVYKRDSYRIPLEMTGGKLILMKGATNSSRGLDWYKGPSLTVKAASGATAENPTTSWITKETGASSTDMMMQVRDNAMPLTVEANARLVMDVSLEGNAINKNGVGELVLASAANTTNALTVNAGTLTVTGTTSTGTTTMAAGTVLRGTGVIAGSLVMNEGAVLEVYSAVAPLEVRGTISSSVKLRLADTIAVTAAIPVISMPNVTDTTTVNISVENQPSGTTLEWLNNILYLIPEGMTSSVTEVKATVSGDANWSALPWTDMNGVSVTPDWRSVTAVTLTATTNATVTRDVATLTLAALTLTETEYTLTLEGAPLPSTMTTLVANTSIVFGFDVLSMIPTNLSGAKNLTFNSTVTSLASGGDTTYAYDNFTGNWIVESGATLNMNGDGGQMGVLKTTGAESGTITVKNGATIALNGGHVFGWGDTDAQRNRKVLVVDGGHVEVTASDSKNQYIRRTIELKNGATLNSSNSSPNSGRGINFTRDANVLVTEGEATLTGYLGIGCDSGNSEQQNEARFVVSENATLKIAGVMKDGTNASPGNSYPIHYSGRGTVILTGANTYTKNQTTVSESVTVLVNGSHTAGMAYIINEGASFGGTGTLLIASVTFDEGSKLVVVDKADPLTLQLGSSITFPEGGVMVTPPAGITVDNPAKLLKVNKPMTAANLTLTESANYAIDVMQEGDWYTALCKQATLVTELHATAGQSLSDIFDPETSMLSSNATLTIDFGNVAEGGTATPGTFTFDNDTHVAFALIKVQGSNGGTLLKTGAGTVATSAFTRDTSCTDLTLDATLFTAFYTGNQTLDGWSLGLYVTADETVTLSNVFTVNAGATLKKVGEGTLKLSSQNIFNDNSALQILEGALHLNARKESISGDILVATDATLKLTRNDDLINYKATNIIDIYGTLDLDAPTEGTRWTLQGGNTLNLYPGAQVIGLGQLHDNTNGYYGALDWAGAGAIYVKANNGVTGTVTISANLRMRADVTIEVEEGMTAIVSGTIYKGSAGKTLTKSGAGTLQYNCPVNPNSLSVTAGTLAGAGVIGGTLTFSEGTFLELNPNATQTLMVNGAISGTAQLRLATDVTQRTPVIASNQSITEAFTLVTDYPRVVETLEGVTTLYVEPHPITELVATLSGDTPWDGIVWKTSQDVSVDIGTTNLTQVATITFNLAADAQLTFADNMTTLFPALTKIKIASTLDNAATVTLCGNTVTLPTVEAVSANAPITLCSAATSLTVSSLVSTVTTGYGFGLDVALLNACTTVSLPATYRLIGDGVVQKTLSGGVRIAQGKVTVGNELSSVTALAIESGATLKVTTKAALTNFLTSDKLALGSTTLTGAGTLELAFENAETILEMTGNGGTFTGDVTVTSGTLKFPNGTGDSGGTGPINNRVITVTGANAALATGTNNDATGWSIAGRQRIVLTEQGEFKVYKRDTLKTPVTMAGGVIRLMETAENSGRGLDWFNSPTLTVNALVGATTNTPTTSYITYAKEATGDAIKMNIRDGSFPVEVAENACLVVEVNLYGGAITKTGTGELVLTNAENSYGATTINAGTLTVLGSTGTGATTMAVGTTLRGTGTVKGALTFTNTTETVEGVTTTTGWPTFEVDVTTGGAPLTVTGTITGKAKLAFTGDIASLASIPVVISTQESVADSFEGIPDGFTFTKVDNMHILVNANAQAYTALYATVTADENWSNLTWTTDAEGTEIVATPIAWDLVESVTLMAEANATVTRDVSTTSMTSLIVLDSEYTLTLTGYALPVASTLVVDGALCLGEGVVTAMPNLRGAGALTFMGGEIISTHAGNAGTTYAYDDFMGRWVLANGTTMRIRGVGAQKGQLNWDSTVEGSGLIEVRQGARLVLEAQNVFGWGAVNELHQRKVLVVDGGEVEISTAENYIRRTIELKNGATLACPATNSTVYFSRGATIEVTEGEATITGKLNISCDNAGSSVGKGATIRVDEGATLNLPGSIAYGKNGNTFALTYTGGGTVNVTGENTYHTYTETIVDEGVTFIMDGTHIAPGENTLKPYTFKAGATLMGSGIINGAVTFNEGAVVVADGQALTLGAVTSSATVIEVTPEAAAMLVDADDTVTVFTATSALDVAQYSVASEYALEVHGYALVVKRKFITLTGTDNFATETQQALRAIVMDALPDTVTEGEYVVAVEVHTKGEVDKTPTVEEVDALLGCFVNVETVEFNNNTATVKIDYEFGLADVLLDTNLNLIFTAMVEGPTTTADYAAGVTFTIIDEVSQESWEIDAANVEASADAVGSVYLTLPDAYEVNGKQKSILTNFIGTRKFKVRVKR